jgi:hypothetical protein
MYKKITINKIMNSIVKQKLLLDKNPYFQDKNYFIKGRYYYLITCVEKGFYPNNYCVIPSCPKIERCGYFINAQDYGWGDNRNVIHTFKILENGIRKIIKKDLNYHGTTRFFEALDMTNLQELMYYSNYYKNICDYIKIVFCNNDICRILEEFLF